MATGLRVLVVSHGESALAVLKEQLPKEVQPLAIALLSNERQGLRQVESAIREIQSVVEETSPQNRRAIITRIEKGNSGAQAKSSDDRSRLRRDCNGSSVENWSQRGNSRDLAKRTIAEREVYRWFVDRPSRFASETKISDLEVLAAGEARRRIGDLIDHFDIVLPAPADLPSASTIAQWHEALVAAAGHSEVPRSGPARSIHLTTIDEAHKAVQLAKTLDEVRSFAEAANSAHWLKPLWMAAICDVSDPWCNGLRERVKEIAAVDTERAGLLKHSVELPAGFLDNEDAKAAVARGAAGEKLWFLMAIGKGDAKSLIGAIKYDGAQVKDRDVDAWKHIDAVLGNAFKQGSFRPDAFARDIGVPNDAQRRLTIEAFRKMLSAADAAKAQSTLLASIVATSSI